MVLLRRGLEESALASVITQSTRRMRRLPRVCPSLCRAHHLRTYARMAASPEHASWTSLGTSAAELRLDATLPTGQSFRWRRVPGGDFVGVVSGVAYHLRQADNDVQFRRLDLQTATEPAASATAKHDDAAILREYFTLDTKLADLYVFSNNTHANVHHICC